MPHSTEQEGFLEEWRKAAKKEGKGFKTDLPRWGFSIIELMGFDAILPLVEQLKAPIREKTAYRICFELLMEAGLLTWERRHEIENLPGEIYRHPGRLVELPFQDNFEKRKHDTGRAEVAYRIARLVLAGSRGTAKIRFVMNLLAIWRETKEKKILEEALAFAKTLPATSRIRCLIETSRATEQSSHLLEAIGSLPEIKTSEEQRFAMMSSLAEALAHGRHVGSHVSEADLKLAQERCGEAEFGLLLEAALSVYRKRIVDHK